MSLTIAGALAVASPVARAQPAPAPPPPEPAVAPPPLEPTATTPPAATTGGLPPPAPAASPAASTPGAGGLPPPLPASGIGAGLAESANLTGAPSPSELAPSAADEWRFSFHGFTRAPMRVGIGSRPQCPAGTPAGTAVGPGGMPMPATGAAQVPCAGPGQSTTALHTPFVPDSQYLDWRYDRQQEYDWTELFFNYGNSLVTGTVAIDAFGFSDAEYIAYSNASTQLGIAQGFLTIHPDLGAPRFRAEAKVGSFWDKFGMAGEYDAGKYDTYMFGRTHQMGERIALEYDVGDLTLRASHGIGTRAEQLAFTQLQAGNPTLPSGNESNYPGFTLLNHAHAGVSYKKLVDVNVHYLSSWAQDYRAVGVDNAQFTDGHIDVYGAEVRLKPGGAGGRLYAAYSRILATNPQVVGPVVEAVHSLGGGNYESGNGVLDNFLGCSAPAGATTTNNFGGYCGTTQNSIGAAHGTVDTIEVQYDYSFGALYRKLATGEGFWGGGWDANLSVFAMYSAVSSTLTTQQTGSPLLGDGVKKLKWGGDLVVVPLPWLGFGVRADYVQPTNIAGANQTFTVVSPKIVFHTKWVTHEEITIWYSHYAYQSSVLPQPPNGVVNPNAGGVPGPFPPDANVVGLKGTFWW